MMTTSAGGIVPPLQCLDARDLHAAAGVGHRMDALQNTDIGDAFGVEGIHRLVDQGDRRHGEDDAPVSGKRAVGDGGGEHGLAPAGRRLHDDPPLAGRDGFAQQIERIFLVGTKGAFHHRPPFLSGIPRARAALAMVNLASCSLSPTCMAASSRSAAIAAASAPCCATRRNKLKPDEFN